MTSIELPANVRSRDVASALAGRGFEIAWRSAYLVSQNWIQIGLMGEYDPAALRRLPNAVAEAVGRHAGAARGIFGVRDELFLTFKTK